MKLFNDIIIGLEIISKWNDGTNGKSTLNNPILTKEINVNVGKTCPLILRFI